VARRVDIDLVLLERARRRELTRSNTESGTPERQAVDRVTYLRRRDRRIGPTAREALGHQKPGYRPAQISFFAEGPPRRIVIEGLSRRDVSRAARYDAFVSNLANGRILPAEFRRKIRAWRPIAGFRFLSDPDAVLALIEELRAADIELFYYEPGRS
jgi:hypothetical protein